METVNLNKVYERLLQMSRDISQMKEWLREDFPLSNEIVSEIEISRKKSRKELISHEEMTKEFG